MKRLLVFAAAFLLFALPSFAQAPADIPTFKQKVNISLTNKPGIQGVTGYGIGLRFNELADLVDQYRDSARTVSLYDSVRMASAQRLLDTAAALRQGVNAMSGNNYIGQPSFSTGTRELIIPRIGLSSVAVAIPSDTALILAKVRDSLTKERARADSLFKAVLPNFEINMRTTGWLDDSNAVAFNTLAAQRAFDSLYVHGGGTMVVPSSARRHITVIDSLRCRSVGSGQYSFIAIRIVGERTFSPLFGTIGTGVLSNEHSVLKSRATGTAVINVEGNSFQSFLLEIVDLEVRTYNNPQISGINAYWAQQFRADKVFINSGSYNVQAGQPLNPAKYGLLPPGNSNAALTNIGELTIAGGFYTGLFFTEHMRIGYYNGASLVRGLVPLSSGHDMIADRVCLQRCTYPIVKDGDGDSYIQINSLDIERVGANQQGQTDQFDANNEWQKTLTDIYDPGNYLYGHVTFKAVRGGASHDTSFSMVGGGHLDIHRIGTTYRAWARDPNGSIVLATAGSPNYLNGRVGIGTNDPQSTLHVAGTVTGTAFSTNPVDVNWYGIRPSAIEAGRGTYSVETGNIDGGPIYLKPAGNPLYKFELGALTMTNITGAAQDLRFSNGSEIGGVIRNGYSGVSNGFDFNHYATGRHIFNINNTPRLTIANTFSFENPTSNEVSFYMPAAGTVGYISHGGWGMGPGKYGIGDGTAPTGVFDNANRRLGIGTTAPAATLHVAGDAIIGTVPAYADNAAAVAAGKVVGTLYYRTGHGLDIVR